MTEEKAVKLCKNIWWSVVWTLRHEIETQKAIMSENHKLSHEYMIAQGRVDDIESYIHAIKTQAALI